MGIPKGNTVAIAGDPGTGKTTFLLSFFRWGKVEGRQVKLDGSGRGSAKEVFDNFNNLIHAHDAGHHAAKESGSTNDGQGTENTGNNGEQKAARLNIFISLESSFERIMESSHSLICAKETACMERSADGNNQDATGGQGNQPAICDDTFIFIDATSLLSGRLEDRLRYPTVKQPHGSSHGWERYRFNLGGFDPTSQGNLHLCWQPDNTSNPIRIEMIEQEQKDSPFSSGGPCYRLYDLMTQTVTDPGQRIRLLKDLLAEILSRFRNAANLQKRALEVILTVDSLSALLATLDGDRPGEAASRGQRLHILNLVRWLEESGVTSLMACEAVREEGQSLRRQPLFLGRQERYIASGVIQLDYHQYRSGDLMRYLRILKMRGAAHDMRAHAYDLGKNGIDWLEPLFAEPESNGGS